MRASHARSAAASVARVIAPDVAGAARTQTGLRNEQAGGHAAAIASREPEGARMPGMAAAATRRATCLGFFSEMRGTRADLLPLPGLV